MSGLIGVLVLLAGAAALARYAGRARGAWAGPRTDGMRARSGVPQRTLGQELRHLRHSAVITDWLEGRRHEREMTAKGITVPAVQPAAPPRGRFIPGRLVFRPPARAAAAPGGNAGAPGTATPGPGAGAGPPAQPPSRPSPAPASQPAHAPASQPAHAPASAPASRAAEPPQAPGLSKPGQPAPPPVPGRTTITMASAEKLTEGITEIHASAAAGGIHAKRAAIAACEDALTRFAAMLRLLSRTMSEPGRSYGPEITEPLGKAADMATAAAMAVSDSGTNVATLINMTVGELATSGRQAPDRSELTEAGAA